MTLQLNLLKETLCILRLSKEEPIPAWVYEESFYSITKTLDELTIVTLQNSREMNMTVSLNWRAFKVKGPLDFSLVGILSELSTLLAKASIPLYAISTFDTDYLLVKSDQVMAAIKAFESGGIIIKP